MLRHDDQFVGGQFDWFLGVVEDTNDPKKLNRVKVRCFGYHTDDKTEVKTEDLPFATVMMPSTSPSVEGIGQNHQLLSGSWVVGFFRDGPSAQDPIILGSIMSFTEETIDTSLGFQGTYGNKSGTSDVPTEVDDLNANQVTKTVGGHLVELDNTVGLERINIKHGTNTSTLNIDQDGITILKSTGIGDEPKTHTLTLNPSTNTINLLHHSGTTINISDEGTVSIDASNDIVNIDGNTTITGTLHVTEAQTNAKTIVAQGTITDKGATLATHVHTEQGDGAKTSGPAAPDPA
jgi:hypothetical protein